MSDIILDFYNYDFNEYISEMFEIIDEPPIEDLEVKRVLVREITNAMEKAYKIPRQVFCSRFRLVRNGYNDRIAILDNGLGKLEFCIQRKRCPRCGEIKPDYSKFVPKYGNYHENYKRRARQHHMEGLMPPQIQRVFKIDFGIQISLTIIVNWVNKIAKPLRKTLQETTVPSSGYWGYDEIHLRISKNRMYAIDTVDVNTRFVPVAKIAENMGRNEGKKVLMEGRRGKNLWINWWK